MTKSYYEQGRHKSLLRVYLTVDWGWDLEEAVKWVMQHIASRIAFRALGQLSSEVIDRPADHSPSCKGSQVAQDSQHTDT